LTYGGTRTGTFDSVTDNLPFLNAELIYGAGFIQILLQENHVPYIIEANTFNERAVATYLDDHSTVATGDFGD
jgi:hypothetical protein